MALSPWELDLQQKEDEMELSCLLSAFSLTCGCIDMHAHRHSSLVWVEPARMHLSGSTKLQSLVELKVDPPCLLG